MSGTPQKQQPALHERLLDGFTHASRKDGSVHTVKQGKSTVAEVCVGSRATRMNVRAKAQVPKGLTLSGKSKSWPQGGVVVTDGNLAACRALLASLTSAPPAPAAPAPAKSTTPMPRKATARTRSTRKTTAAA